MRPNAHRNCCASIYHRDILLYAYKLVASTYDKRKTIIVAGAAAGYSAKDFTSICGMRLYPNLNGKRLAWETL